MKIIDFVQNTDGPLTIGINSGGGSTGVAAFLLEFLNENKGRITLIGITGVFSAAFWLFYGFKGRKKIANNCRGMYHYATQDVRLCAKITPDGSSEESIISALKSDRIRNDAFAGQFMTPKELRRFRQNLDVYFSPERMAEIFPEAELI